ncbi:la-related protein 7 isoform X3 [Bombyx mori]
MSESENLENADQNPKHENSARKRVRHRKKLIYEKILKQMEFYFSDANLTKDRYLGELVKNDPYVALEVFLKFNKIRSMTQDIVDIAKAMKHSTMLELSEDKLKVKRKTSVISYDADARTVYVESIPVTASRDWLERVFSDFGTVVYISLPKFKNTQKIKGYGFIEFNTTEEAQKCINTFTKMGCKLPTYMPPEDLSSIKMFSVEESPENSTDIKEGKDEDPPKKKKKKEKKPPKGLDTKTNELDSDKRVDTPTETKTFTDTESRDEATSQDESKNCEETTRKKKFKKRTTKEKKGKNGLEKNEAPKGALWGLQVLAKKEWKSLRNKYLNLQRKYMKELKNELQNKKHYMRIPPPASPTGEVNASTDTNVNENLVMPEKIPGVFVKEKLLEPCIDVRLTKRTIRTNVHVLHVDVKESQSEVVIRFDSPKAADEYCANSHKRARVLSGAEEQAQWGAARAARRRPRGRTRLLARRTHALLAPASPQPTNTHLRFDEE